ncbi:MAG: aminotransferase class I/II-fold pyridoxal phosphate-dependent enzyme [Acidimicrobiales bacterium]
MSTDVYRPSGRGAAEIAADVEAAVAAGRAPAGTLLPPVRGLAAELGVAAGTVAAAYRLLGDRGVVETNRRAGTRVRGRPMASRPNRAPEVPAGLVDLASGNPDPALLPDDIAALADVVLRLEGSPPVLYGAPAVLPELGAWAARWFRADGIDLGAVTVVGGALDAVERGLQAHLRPGMRVAVEDPGYAALLDLVAALELHAEPVAVDDDGITPDQLRRALERGAQAVVLTPRAQNPTGAALSTRRAEALTEVLTGWPDILVIEDDHAGPVAGHPVRTIAGAPGAGAQGRALVVRSCSKILGPDLRVALVAGDPDTVDAIERRQAVGAGWVSYLLQQVAVTLLSNPETNEGLSLAAQVYAERREVLIDALAAQGIAAHGRSGLNVWVPVLDEAAVLSGMAARGWAIAPGSRFRLATPPGVRITTAALDPEDAPTVACDLAASLGSGGRTRAG